MALATYELPASLKLTQGCFGKRYSVRIGNQSATMLLPEVTWLDDHPIVAAPRSRVGEPDLAARLGDRRIDDQFSADTWGSANSWYPARRFVEVLRVNMIALEFRLPAGQMTYGETTSGRRGAPRGPFIDALLAGVDRWFEDLRMWVEVATDQDADPDHPLPRSHVVGGGLSILTEDNGVLSIPATARTITVLGDRGESLTLARFRQVLSLLRRGHRPPDAHLLMRDARSDLRRDRLRKAVVDAATAVEISLADFNQRVTRVRTPPRPTLGWFVSQRRIAAAARLPARTRTSLVDVRNDAIHHNVIPSASGARDAVSVAQSIVERLEPSGL